MAKTTHTVKHAKHAEQSENKDHEFKEHKHETNGVSVKTLAMAAIALVVIVTVAYYYGKGSAGPAFSGGQPTMELYVMSQCPYGVQAEDLIFPVIKELKGYANLKLDFIGGGSAGSFSSLHGENEVKGDKVQLCAREQGEKYMEFILCMNKDASQIPNNWESCAKSSGLDVNALKTCYEGAQGDKLLEASFAASSKAGAQGSPTIIIAGKPYEGRRDSKSITKALCAAGGNAASACRSIPEAVKFDVTIVNDVRCKDCSTAGLESNLKTLFEGAQIKTVDVLSDEGKALVTKYNVQKAPSFIFDAKVKGTQEWNGNQNIWGAFDEVGGGLKLKDEATGATYFIDPAKQATFEKEQLAAKQASMRKLGIDSDNKPQIDFFVMSYCPYGNQAEELIKPVYDQMKGKADFKPRYVIYKNYQGGSKEFCLDGYCSMHGIQELHQDIREMCVNKYMGVGSWFDFAIAMNSKCTYQNADTCWEAVAKGLKLDTNKISKCQNDEGLALVKSESDLNTLLGVQGSPSVFVEGTSYEGGRTSAGFQSALCGAFKTKPSECANVVVEATPTAAPAGGCGV